MAIGRFNVIDEKDICNELRQAGSGNILANGRRESFIEIASVFSIEYGI